MKNILVIGCFFLILEGVAQDNPDKVLNRQFNPGDIWYDTEGNPINAHGGGILYHDGMYYWFGQIMFFT